MRANDERSPAVRPAPRSASMGSVRVASQAGAAPKSRPVTSARPLAKASTSGEGVVSIGISIVAPAKASDSSSRAAPMATSRPASAPPTASSTLSTRASVTISRRDAPIASRTAVWPRRATARASRRLATLAQAMSSTSPQTASRICRLRPYCSFITPTPAPAGTTAMTCCGSTRSTVAIQFGG